MRQRLSKDEKEIKEFTGLMHDFLLEQIPPEETLQETYQLSGEFFEKMEGLVQNDRKTEKKKERRYAAFAAAAAAAVFLVSQTKFFADASESLVWNFVDHSSFQFEWNTDVSHTPEYEMQYVPKGYEPITEKYYGICGCQIYQNPKGDRLCLHYMPVDVTLDIENGSRDFITLKENEGRPVYYMKALEDEESFLIWENREKTVKFCLSGKLAKEELLSVLAEIRIVSK